MIKTLPTAFTLVIYSSVIIHSPLIFPRPPRRAVKLSRVTTLLSILRHTDMQICFFLVHKCHLHETSQRDLFLYTVQQDVHSHYLGVQREALTTSVKASEAFFHSLPGKRTSFWKTSSMNSMCPASASVNKLQYREVLVVLVVIVYKLGGT